MQYVDPLVEKETPRPDSHFPWTRPDVRLDYLLGVSRPRRRRHQLEHALLRLLQEYGLLSAHGWHRLLDIEAHVHWEETQLPFQNIPLTFQVPLGPTVREIMGQTMEVRLKAYKICKERGHKPGMRVRGMPPQHECEHCGTWFRYDRVLVEDGAPIEGGKE
jgi:hypothetical protein